MDTKLKELHWSRINHTHRLQEAEAHLAEHYETQRGQDMDAVRLGFKPDNVFNVRDAQRVCCLSRGRARHAILALYACGDVEPYLHGRWLMASAPKEGEA
jgi:hypothetical protein